MNAITSAQGRGTGILPVRPTGVSPVEAGPGRPCDAWAGRPCHEQERPSLWSDQRGQSTVEWVLLLVFVGLPLYGIFRVVLGILQEHYRMVQFMETMPFP